MVEKIGCIKKGLPAVLIACLIVFGGCSSKPDTPEKAFIEFSQRILFYTSRKSILKYATKEHLQKLENTFDMIVISEMWPRNLASEKVAEKEDTVLLKVSGFDKSNNPARGVYVFRKIDGIWKALDGEWIYIDGEFIKNEVDLDCEVNYTAEYYLEEYGLK